MLCADEDDTPLSEAVATVANERIKAGVDCERLAAFLVPSPTHAAGPLPSVTLDVAAVLRARCFAHASYSACVMPDPRLPLATFV